MCTSLQITGSAVVIVSLHFTSQVWQQGGSVVNSACSTQYVRQWPLFYIMQFRIAHTAQNVVITVNVCVCPERSSDLGSNFCPLLVTRSSQSIESVFVCFQFSVLTVIRGGGLHWQLQRNVAVITSTAPKKNVLREGQETKIR